MTSFVFQHRRGSGNVGDDNCCPGQWFDFGPSVFQNFGEDAPACDVVVFGGGQVAQQCLDGGLYHSPDAKARVIWGVGMTEKRVKTTHFQALQGLFDLISSRDLGLPGIAHVPCPSAMSPFFDAPPPPSHDVVLFTHDRKSDGVQKPDGIPSRGNHGGTLNETLEFLASGATIVTNSYHGVYWGLCLGRRVLCLPYSSKFDGFLIPPVMADPADWLKDIYKAEPRPEILPHARDANQVFYQMVMNLV